MPVRSLKIVLFLLMGSLALVAVVFLGRRDAQPGTVPRSPHPEPPSSELSSHHRVESGKPISGPEEKVQEPAKKSTPRIDTIHAKGPTEIKIGRPEKPDQEAILNAATWQTFYEECREKKVGGADYEDLILRRVSRELGLDQERSESLRTLFKAEQTDVTKAIIDTYGGADGFEKKKDDLAKYSKVVLEEFRALRSVIRQSKENEYLRLLSDDQLALVNEHLRNTEIQIESSYGPDGVHYLVGGVGKPK